MKTLSENVSATRRKNITHFQQMKPDEFIRWMRKVKAETGGILKNVKVVMKIDGLGARFGKNFEGQPFFEGSRTGPIFDSGAFSKHAKSKYDDPEIITRAEHYDDMLEIIKNASFMKVLPNDTKIPCEIFFNPLGKDDGKKIVFVHIAYDKNKLGTEMSIMPYDVLVASTGEEHPNKEVILKKLYAESNSKIKIIDPNLKLKAINITAFSDAASLISDKSLEILKSRKAVDKDEREALLRQIQQMKDELADYLLNHPNVEGKFRLGSEIEGIVLHLPQSTGTEIFKITTPSFKQQIKKVNEDASMRKDTEHELFLGRMQPLHKGHQRIIQSMENPIVVIVKGKVSSEDVERNPLDAKTQERLLKKACPGIEISISPNGYIPGILWYFKKQGKDITTIYCGADRIEGYKEALKKANAELPTDSQYNPKFKETERFTSATAVRQAIRDGDYEKFKKLMPEEIWDEWDALKKALSSTDVEIKNKTKSKKKIKTFREFLELN